MHLDPMLPYLVGTLLAVLLLGLLLRKLNQPHVTAYLIAGLIMGPHGFAVIEDEEMLSRLGNIGVVLLLFFIGMEVSPKRLLEKWKLALLGTLLQITFSVGCVWPLGSILNWPIERTVLIGFVISLSSTAVVLRLLQDWKEFNTQVGQNVLVILLAQDLAVAPMLVILSLFGESQSENVNVMAQISGFFLFALIVAYLAVKETIHLPLRRLVGADREMQIFAASSLCLGLALLTGLMGLSTALGAFLAGMLIGVAKETHWVNDNMEPVRVLFVALFFISIGMLIDLDFLRTYWVQVSILLMLVLFVNTFINGVVLYWFGDNWRDSLYAATLLSQIGEFSFVLAAVGIQAHIISDFGYQLTIAIIGLSLLLSPAWIMSIKYFLYRRS